jgi:endonuclease YncB( thermonuclease family)
MCVASCDSDQIRQNSNTSPHQEAIYSTSLKPNCHDCFDAHVHLVGSKALADFSGPVVSVLDGDTIKVPHNTRAERIRRSGIDCPEKGQLFCTP